MGKLIEICNSTYNHTPLTSFGKEYYKHRLKDKIICSECVSAYLVEVSKTLTSEIMNCIKNVDMKFLREDKISRRNDSFSFTFEKEINNTYMQYLLPIRFGIDISFFYSKNEYYNTEGDLEEYYKIAEAIITPIVCDSSYPSFKLNLGIRNIDTGSVIEGRILNYLTSFVFSFYNELDDMIVQIMMNKKGSTEYSSLSGIDSGTSGPKCSKCSIAVWNEKYIFNNNIYCLDCMYEYVVKEIISNNLSDAIGLSISKDSSAYAIVNTSEWKRSIIDKYNNVMKDLGFNTGITHVIMQCV